jgi:acetoin utilization deacetylase AcuC-like enzyme
MLVALAEKYAGGKIAFLLEGGYDLAALKNSVAAVLEKMAGKAESEAQSAKGGEAVEPVIRKVRRVQERYW